MVTEAYSAYPFDGLLEMWNRSQAHQQCVSKITTLLTQEFFFGGAVWNECVGVERIQSEVIEKELPAK